MKSLLGRMLTIFLFSILVFSAIPGGVFAESETIPDNDSESQTLSNEAVIVSDDSLQVNGTENGFDYTEIEGGVQLSNILVAVRML